MLRFTLDFSCSEAEAKAICEPPLALGAFSQSSAVADVAHEAARALTALHALPTRHRLRDPLLAHAHLRSGIAPHHLDRPALEVLELLHHFLDPPPSFAGGLCRVVSTSPSAVSAAVLWCGRGTRLAWVFWSGGAISELGRRLGASPKSSARVCPDLDPAAAAAFAARVLGASRASPEADAASADATNADAADAANAAFGHGCADLVIGERAADASGAPSFFAWRQRLQIETVAFEIAALLPSLAAGGTALLRLLDVFSEPAWFALLERLRACFARALLVRPLASSPGSTDLFFVGLAFRRAPEDLAWAAELPASCFSRAPPTLSPPCPGLPPGCRAPFAWPEWSAPLANAYSAIRDVALRRAAGGSAPWCSEPEGELWAASLEPLFAHEQMGLMVSAPRNHFERFRRMHSRPLCDPPATSAPPARIRRRHRANVAAAAAADRDASCG